MKEGKVTEYDKELQTGLGEKRVGRIVGNDGEEFEIRKLDESLQTGFFEKKVGRIVKISSSGGGGGGGSGFFENIISSIFGIIIFFLIISWAVFSLAPYVISQINLKLLIPIFFGLVIVLSKKIHGTTKNNQIMIFIILLFVIIFLFSIGYFQNILDGVLY